MLGAEMPVPVGQEEYWYQTRLGVRAEPLVSLGITRPHSLCISSSTGQWVSGTRLGWLVASSGPMNLNTGQNSPQRVLGTHFSLAE